MKVCVGVLYLPNCSVGLHLFQIKTFFFSLSMVLDCPVPVHNSREMPKPGLDVVRKRKDS